MAFSTNFPLYRKTSRFGNIEGGAVTIDELLQIVDNSTEHCESYSVCEGLKDNALIMDRNRSHTVYFVFYYERGCRIDEKIFSTENEACEYFYSVFRK